MDLDVSVDDGRVAEDYRLKASIPTIRYILENEPARLVIIGHRGRPHFVETTRGEPNWEYVEELSLEPVAKYLEKLLKNYLNEDLVKNAQVYVMDNLRFEQGEETNDPEFARELAQEGEVYINDAFGVCHREVASVVDLPGLLPHAAGLRLVQEVENLSQVLEEPDPSTHNVRSGHREPVVIIVGGGKMDKVLLIDKLLNVSDTILVGGVLPKEIESYCRDDGKMCVVAAHLTPDGSDITPDSARNFAEIIKSAGTIVWNGPLGDIDSGFWDATEIIADAVADSHGYKVVGGGDMVRALDELGLLNKIDWVSTGGGAMLEFLAYKDLPGLEALRR